MVYLDTSVLVALLVPAEEFGAARTGVASLRPGDIAISGWGLLEFTSVLGRRVRGGSLPSTVAKEVLGQLERTAATSFAMFTPGAEDFARAQRWVAEFESGLRAADGLHLALAHRHAAQLFTFDRGLREVARRFEVALYR